MFKFFLYIMGIILVSVGIFFTIIYCNLLSMGYSILDLGKFIIRTWAFWFIVLGLINIILALERWIKNELLLRHNFKLERRKSL